MVNDLSFDQIFDGANPKEVLERTRPFQELMMQYNCALMEVRTKLEVLNAELALVNSRNPFESIKCRLKSPVSILEKMKRRGLEPTVENMENCITDIAGIRVICSFPDDIYALAESLIAQDDIVLCERKDYIAHPKANGYRSLHLILNVPIFLTSEKKYMKVEVQFRTIAMDFWASVEHKVKYKKNIEKADIIVEQLKECADVISLIDGRMQEIRDQIEHTR